MWQLVMASSTIAFLHHFHAMMKLDNIPVIIWINIWNSGVCNRKMHAIKLHSIHVLLKLHHALMCWICLQI